MLRYSPVLVAALLGAACGPDDCSPSPRVVLVRVENPQGLPIDDVIVTFGDRVVGCAGEGDRGEPSVVFFRCEDAEHDPYLVSSQGYDVSVVSGDRTWSEPTSFGASLGACGGALESTSTFELTDERAD